MPKEVIKKDGTREFFNAVKIRNSIAGAVQRTDLSEERKNEEAARKNQTENPASMLENQRRMLE